MITRIDFMTRGKQTRRIGALSGCICLVITLTQGCTGGTIEGEAGRRKPVPTVDVVVAKRETLTPHIESFGTITYRTKTEISSIVDGRIEKIFVDEGERVRKGALLAVLKNIRLEIRKRKADSSVEQAHAALELAEAQKRKAEHRVERQLLSLEKTVLECEQKKRALNNIREEMQKQEQLLEIGGITGEQYEDIKFSYQAAETDYRAAVKAYEMGQIGFRDRDILSAGFTVPKDEPEKKRLLIELGSRTAEAEIKAAEARLKAALSEQKSAGSLVSELSMYAPSSGVVGTKYVEEGETVAPDTACFTIFNDEAVYAVFPVPEKDSALLHTAMKTTVVIPAIEDHPKNGKISLISPTVDPQSGNVIVKAKISNTDRLLKPGMFVRVTVITGDPVDKLMIPETALLESRGENGTVFTVVDGRVFPRSVVLGTAEEEKIAVIRGISEGDVIIDNPSSLLREGEKVATR